MTVAFWVASASMLALALAFVLPPLFVARGTASDTKHRDALLQAHRSGVLDAAEYREKLAALGPASMPARAPVAWIVALALLVPLGAIVGYRAVGEPRAFAPPSAAAAAMNAALAGQADAAQPPDMESAIAGLAERMHSTPDDLDGWMLLGRAYKATERFEQARDALANAYRLAPENADVMIEYAEVLVLASPTHRFEGEALTLLQRALERSPDNQRGLWFLGVGSYQRGDYVDAARTWERVLALMPAGSDASERLRERIADARSRAGLTVDTVTTAGTGSPAEPTQAAGIAATPAAAGAALTVTVDIAPALKERIAADDVLFVFARAAEGPRIPLAIQRLSASALPTTVTLDDSSAMMPSMTLSSVSQVVVGARISKTGDATPQAGDLETLSAPLTNTQREPVHLMIDRIVP